MMPREVRAGLCVWTPSPVLLQIHASFAPAAGVAVAVIAAVHTHYHYTFECDPAMDGRWRARAVRGGLILRVGMLLCRRQRRARVGPSPRHLHIHGSVRAAIRQRAGHQRRRIHTTAPVRQFPDDCVCGVCVCVFVCVCGCVCVRV